MNEPGIITAAETAVLVRELDRRYPVLDSGKGVWVTDTAGRQYLDAISGGAAVTSIGHGVDEVVEAAAAQARKISYFYNVHATSQAQEDLAREVMRVAPPGFTRVHFTSGGTEANELALRMVRSYHVERGEQQRHLVVSPAQAYHGASIATFGLTGRAGLQRPYEPYIQQQAHIALGRPHAGGGTASQALAALDALLDEVGPENVAAFLIEPVSAAALPAYSPTDEFWRGLDERRRQHGFLVWFDEVVTGFGRTGRWFVGERTPCTPDVITTGKGLGAGFGAICGMLVRQHIYDAVAAGSRAFEPGHTWDGAPLPCAVGLAVLDYLQREQLVEKVAKRGPRLLEQLSDALKDSELVGEVRGQGFLLGISYVDPRTGQSFLPADLRVAERIDLEAVAQGLFVYSTQATSDGHAGDQTMLAPAFVASDDDLDTLVERVRSVVTTVEADVKKVLARR